MTMRSCNSTQGTVLSSTPHLYKGTAKMSSFEIGWDFGLSDHQKKKIEANNIVAQMFNPPECISDGREVWQIDLPR